MCEAASMVLLKDRVLIGKTTNSHSKILIQNDIEDCNLKPDFVKIEIVPKNMDYSKPLAEWVYNVDHDYFPDWYIQEVDEKRARLALKQWYREHIELQNTDAMNQTQTAGYNSTQKAGSNSTQTAGKGTIQIIRYYDDGWKVKTRVITKQSANKPYKFTNGKWRLVSNSK